MADVRDLVESLATRVREGVWQQWLDGLPEEALDVLRTAGERAQVYALARMRDLRRRAATLAWYAGLDPSRKQARAVARAACRPSPSRPSPRRRSIPPRSRAWPGERRGPSASHGWSGEALTGAAVQAAADLPDTPGAIAAWLAALR